jgi:hypothetical protein
MKVPVALDTGRGWSGSSVDVDANLGERTDDLPVRIHLPSGIFFSGGKVHDGVQGRFGPAR